MKLVRQFQQWKKLEAEAPLDVVSNPGLRLFVCMALAATELT
jgi:hypothetical protein